MNKPLTSSATLAVGCDSSSERHWHFSTYATAQLSTSLKHVAFRVVRLGTIPGIGPRRAEIFVACIDDPHRFESGRLVIFVHALVPRQFQSGEADRNVRIT